MQQGYVVFTQEIALSERYFHSLLAADNRACGGMFPGNHVERRKILAK
jgi:hypothetical protein